MFVDYTKGTLVCPKVAIRRTWPKWWHKLFLPEWIGPTCPNGVQAKECGVPRHRLASR